MGAKADLMTAEAIREHMLDVGPDSFAIPEEEFYSIIEWIEAQLAQKVGQYG
jgi:hypothetical protein